MKKLMFVGGVIILAMAFTQMVPADPRMVEADDYAHFQYDANNGANELKHGGANVDIMQYNDGANANGKAVYLQQNICIDNGHGVHTATWPPFGAANIYIAGNTFDGTGNFQTAGNNCNMVTANGTQYSTTNWYVTAEWLDYSPVAGCGDIRWTVACYNGAQNN